MLEKKWLSGGELLDNRYRIKQLIKAGGMGAVYQAEDLFLDHKICAVKQMLEKFSHPSEKREAIDRFLFEIQVLAGLKHPNIPRITDHFLEKASFYFVMEFIEGTDLATLLKKEGKPGLPYQQVVEWAIQVTVALEYIHNLTPPLAHRDIKPSNLLLRKNDERILLIDFGIARVVSTINGFWIGTQGYAPPEQQMGRPEIRSDLYALGVTIHELLSGIKPESFEFTPLSELKIKVPEKLEDILYQALQWNPEDRYQTAKQIKDDLISVIDYRPKIKIETGFEEKAALLGEKTIFPILRELMTRYKNECTTKFLPRQLDYLVFTLGVPVNFELVIRKNENLKLIEFFEKQGILEKLKLGEVSPEEPEVEKKVMLIIDKFIENYEIFKGGGFNFNT